MSSAGVPRTLSPRSTRACHSRRRVLCTGCTAWVRSTVRRARCTNGGPTCTRNFLVEGRAAKCCPRHSPSPWGWRPPPCPLPHRPAPRSRPHSRSRRSRPCRPARRPRTRQNHAPPGTATTSTGSCSACSPTVTPHRGGGWETSSCARPGRSASTRHRKVDCPAFGACASTSGTSATERRFAAPCAWTASASTTRRGAATNGPGCARKSGAAPGCRRVTICVVPRAGRSWTRETPSPASSPTSSTFWSGRRSRASTTSSAARPSRAARWSVSSSTRPAPSGRKPASASIGGSSRRRW